MVAAEGISSGEQSGDDEDPIAYGDMHTVSIADLSLSSTYTIKPEAGSSSFSNPVANLELRPYTWLQSEMRAVYDHTQDRIDTYQLDLTFTNKRMDFGLGYGYEVRSNIIATAELYYEISPLWTTRLFRRYDWRNSEFLEQEYMLERELHDFFISINY
ncbi:MAG: hypothetical protein IH991_16405, partial [Planctomycetes bacterium]|nr:hypothetical protein [Planctomycetota bacterium]